VETDDIKAIIEEYDAAYGRPPDRMEAYNAAVTLGWWKDTPANWSYFKRLWCLR
jgi:hypothetical protein